MSDIETASKPVKISVDLSGPQKAAAILVAIGRPDAARLLKHFNSDDLRKLAGHARTLEAIAPQDFDLLVEEFEDAFAEGAPVSEAGERFEGLLRESLPEEEVQAVYTDKPVRSGRDQNIWLQIAKLSPDALAKYVTKQNPQVAAFTISKLPTDISGRLMLAIPREQRTAIVQRLLHMGTVSDVAAEMLEDVLLRDLFSQNDNESEKSKHQEFANMLNHLNKDEMDDLITSLDTLGAEDLSQIKSKLFSFDDIERLSKQARIRLFDGLGTEQISLSLKGASSSLKELVLSSLPQRGRRMVESELSAPSTSITDNQVNEARRAIAKAAIDLANSGAIRLSSDEAADT